MPPTYDAAAVTDGYRVELLRLRNAAAVAALSYFDRVNLDAGHRDVRQQLESFSSSAADVVSSAQLRAQQLAAGYVPAYLAAAGVDDNAPDVALRKAGTIGRGKALDAAYLSAGYGMLWQLGQGAGRASATGYGGALVIRTTRTAVSEAARATLADTIALHPVIVGYERVTALRCCQRCSSHAGQLYHDRHGFYAHPACHCTAEPVLRNVPDRVKRTAATVVQP